MEKLANYICIRSSILIKKLGAFIDTEKSQDFLFKWATTSDRLIDFRVDTAVEHIKLNERHGRRAHFRLESERGNANYNDLCCADVKITGTHFLMHGRATAIVRVPPPRRRRRRGQEANDPKKHRLHKNMGNNTMANRETNKQTKVGSPRREGSGRV